MSFFHPQKSPLLRHTCADNTGTSLQVSRVFRLVWTRVARGAFDADFFLSPEYEEDWDALRVVSPPLSLCSGVRGGHTNTDLFLYIQKSKSLVLRTFILGYSYLFAKRLFSWRT